MNWKGKGKGKAKAPPMSSSTVASSTRVAAPSVPRLTGTIAPANSPRSSREGSESKSSAGKASRQSSRGSLAEANRSERFSRGDRDGRVLSVPERTQQGSSGSSPKKSGGGRHLEPPRAATEEGNDAPRRPLSTTSRASVSSLQPTDGSTAGPSAPLPTIRIGMHLSDLVPGGRSGSGDQSQKTESDSSRRGLIEARPSPIVPTITRRLEHSSLYRDPVGQRPGSGESPESEMLTFQMAFRSAADVPTPVIDVDESFLLPSSEGDDDGGEGPSRPQASTTQSYLLPGTTPRRPGSPPFIRAKKMLARTMRTDRISRKDLPHEEGAEHARGLTTDLQAAQSGWLEPNTLLMGTDESRLAVWNHVRQQIAPPGDARFEGNAPLRPPRPLVPYPIAVAVEGANGPPESYAEALTHTISGEMPGERRREPWELGSAGAGGSDAAESSQVAAQRGARLVDDGWSPSQQQAQEGSSQRPLQSRRAERAATRAPPMQESAIDTDSDSSDDS